MSTPSVQERTNGWATIPVTVPPGLRTWNLIVGIIMAIQAVAIVVMSNDFSLPITGDFLGGPPTTVTDTAGLSALLTDRELLWTVPVGLMVAIFVGLAAADHLLMAAPGIWDWYRRNLEQRANWARWAEYSISASIMIVLISMLCGVSNFGAVLAIFGVNAAMIMFGAVMEMLNQTRMKVNWLPYICGAIVGIIPWIIIIMQVVGAQERVPAGAEGVPTFVYAIVGSYFILFNTFSLNMILQYNQNGPWKNYVFGEKTYMVLSLTAKSLLAWLVFANTLIPTS